MSKRLDQGSGRPNLVSERPNLMSGMLGLRLWDGDE